jgi:hypothetical protein
MPDCRTNEVSLATINNYSELIIFKDLPKGSIDLCLARGRGGLRSRVSGYLFRKIAPKSQVFVTEKCGATV